MSKYSDIECYYCKSNRWSTTFKKDTYRCLDCKKLFKSIFIGHLDKEVQSGSKQD